MPRPPAVPAEVRHRRHAPKRLDPATDAGFRGFSIDMVGQVLLLHDITGHVTDFLLEYVDRQPEETPWWHGNFLGPAGGEHR